uniref:Uncharacterized protein n=1 Tax=Arundo donax TaxID=35708 RepID=A0A0A8ZNX6_ARUDO
MPALLGPSKVKFSTLNSFVVCFARCLLDDFDYFQPRLTPWKLLSNELPLWRLSMKICCLIACFPSMLVPFMSWLLFLDLHPYFVPDVEYKRKIQAQFEASRDSLVSEAQPVLEALVLEDDGALLILIKCRLEAAPCKLKEDVKEIATSNAIKVLAIMKFLCCQVDIQTIGDGFAEGIDDDRAL